MEEIVGFPGYAVESDGRVFSLNYRHRRGVVKELSYGTTMQDGYLLVGLWAGGRRTVVLVHRVVAMAFIANPLNKPEINHKDCDKKNNRFGNLEWVTARENMAHSIVNECRTITESGRMAWRKNCTNKETRHKQALSNCQMTKEQVVFARDMRSSGKTFRAIERATGINRQTIRRAVLGMTEIGK